MPYQAFISYSHAADGLLAPALQSGLQRIAKPFYKLRAMRVFRDETSLHLTPKLWPLIQQSIEESENFVLMASPASVGSPWVQKEINEWLKLHDSVVDNFNIVLTEGEIVWDDAANDFDWGRTTALPSSLKGKFESEPLYLDFRWARESEHLSLRNPRFLNAVGRLASVIRSVPLDTIIGDDVRQHRIFRSVTSSAIVLLLLLLGATSFAAYYANLQTGIAVEQTALAEEAKREANRQRDSAVEAQRQTQAALLAEKEATDLADAKRREADDQRKIAEKQTIAARLSENKAVAALERERATRERERITAMRDSTNRKASILVEQGATYDAQQLFEGLYNSYSTDRSIDGKSRNEGIWWAGHNLGFLCWKRGDFRCSEEQYKGALTLVGESSDKILEPGQQSTQEPFVWQRVAYKRDAVVERGKIATLNRFGEYWRDRALNATSHEQAVKFNSNAKNMYETLLKKLIADDSMYEKETGFIAEVQQKLADTFFDLKQYETAEKGYAIVQGFYKARQDHRAVIGVSKKLVDLYILTQTGDPETLSEEILAIREKTLNLTPEHADIVESYEDLSRVSNVSDKKRDYASMADGTRKWSYTINKLGEFDEAGADQIKPLAELYIKFGKCDRAKILYDSSVKKIKVLQGQESLNGDQIRPALAVLFNAAEFYWDVYRNRSTAAEFYADYVSAANAVDEMDMTYSQLDESQLIKAAWFLTDSTEFDMAEIAFDKALELKSQRSYDEITEAEIFVGKARLQSAQKKFEVAEGHFRKAIEIVERKNGDNSVEVANFYVYLADHFVDRADWQAARPIYEKVEKHYEPMTPAYGQKYTISNLEALEIYVGSLKKRGNIAVDARPAEARQLFEKALKTLRLFAAVEARSGTQKYVVNDRLTEDYYRDLAEVLEALATLPDVPDVGKLRAHALDARQQGKLLSDEAKLTCAKSR